MYSPNIKDIAKKMRRNGKSLSDIVKELGVNKSTVSFWCKDIILTESSIRKIKTKGREKSVRGLLRYSEKKRKERIERNILQKKEGSYLVDNLTNRDILMVGLGLYWGEGYKYENCELGFTNSNPKMILFYFKWLKLWNVEKNSLIFRLTINELFKKEEDNIKLFWMNFLEIENEQFSKTTFIRTKLKKGSIKNIGEYRGILRVKVRKGTSLRNKILGAIEYISNI